MHPAGKVSAEEFPGYPREVREQARRVVDAAGPGQEEVLAKEVQALRKQMHVRGILSINAIPDLVFERAAREGWKRESVRSLRGVADVSPFSVPMWAWLVKEDIFHLEMEELIHDFDSLSGALSRFAPALMGYAVWLISFLAATGLWFAAWASIALFLRGRPALEADILRVTKVPGRHYVAPVLAAILFLLPLAAGLGLALVTCFWLALASAYLRRAELVIVATAIALLAAVLLGSGMLQSMMVIEGQSRRGGWLGVEGAFPEVWPEQIPGAARLVEGTAWMTRFAKARAEMHGGNPAESEKRWTELLGEPGIQAEVLNNRGITRAQQGRIAEALADFEAALAVSPADPPALWNAYQTYLQVFNLDRARKIQPAAWERIQRITPFDFRPAEMEQGEWVASALPVREMWKTFVGFRGEWFREVEKSDMFNIFFRPLSARGAIAFLVFVWALAGVWKLASLKFWVNSTCRVCGNHALIVGGSEAFDLCTACRSHVGEGLRAGHERDRRIQGIGMHRRYVLACSVFVPGSGGLWAGKEVRALLCGMVLSVAFAVVTCSFGGQREGQALVNDLQASVAIFAILLSGVVWVFGALWGIRSFVRIQAEYGIIDTRR